MRISNGIDIIEIERIRKKFEKDLKFKKKIFTEKELKQVEGLEIEYIVLAGKWASKEAFSKALGTGIGKELDWLDIQISNDITGKPHIEVSKDILEKYGIDEISLSISHIKDYAVASVVILFN
ncbi:MAG: holo-ACP synthase [bacterium]|uniref:Holo-[acyl-carrier-protein] synthase n=2 Tax=Bacteria candidate phyla TaxID=1783234 RepID=A0A101I376_UNCT6|nr:MAG: Holo-[acyl-carrier-protein] synthase [candidate division TA06 bacterium 32_111]KUK87539.1 MAG: Holo-[acyl-carrier-protein] synthase [candidate division TA06 bacterium 34_109]MDI6700307.1 holo-ACP synthase [bacterium]HAF08125.1 holo-[acyl-carrier-protein] synthase [candidate division WOR-3 bacterium]HCP16687.1 holo-[acyl-carrier-protein] synthase [candidate division WOR-3 bacterium]